MLETIKRLKLISQLISVGDTDIIDYQILKIEHKNDTDLIDIIDSLKNKDYHISVVKINSFISKNQGLVIFEDTEIEALKLEISNLENEISDLESNKIELEKVIHDFEIKHHNELGDLILKLLKLRQEKYKNDFNNDNTKENEELYEDAKKDYNYFKEEVNIANKESLFDLNDEEKVEIKSIFRKACHMCHPDKFNEDKKEEAQKVFIKLKQAYDKNDLKKVNDIYNSLINGELSDIDNSNNKEDKKQELFKKIENLREKKQELLVDIISIEMSDTYKDISQIKDWGEYFEEKKVILKKELLNLE